MKSFETSDVLDFSIPANLELVPGVLKHIKNYGQVRGLLEKQWKEIELAIVEGLNNAIEHGCNCNADSIIQLRFGWSGKTLKVEIQDPSDYLPGPDVSYDLPEDPLAERGRGLYLMSSMTDSIRHYLSDNRHVLVLEKNVGYEPSFSSSAEELNEMLESMTEELSVTYESLSSLLNISNVLAKSKSFEEFSAEAVSLIERISDASHVVLRVNESQFFLKLVGKTENARFPEILELDRHVIETRVALEGQEIILDSLEHDDTGDPLLKGAGSACVFPILYHGKVLGTCGLNSIMPENFNEARKLDMIRIIVEFLGVAMEMETSHHDNLKQQKAVRDLEIAEKIQDSLSPEKFPSSPDYSVFGMCQPSVNVGGDYFDIRKISEDHLLLVIADVMGKGLPAALLANIMRTMVHAYTEIAQDTKKFMERINHLLSADLDKLDVFITAQVIHIDLSNGLCDIVNAGHCPTLLKSKNGGEIREFSPFGLPLGIEEEGEYEVESFQLEPGDQLLLMTDGIYEATDKQGQMLKIEGIKEWFLQQNITSPDIFCRSLMNYTRTYSEQNSHTDDITLVSLHWKGGHS